MNAAGYMLAVDLGTSGPKVALVADSGEIAARTVRPLRVVNVEGGGAEQDPASMWAAVVDAAKDVLAHACVPADAIRGLICESQYFSIIPVGARGEALMNCIMWIDTRGAPHTARLYERCPNAVERWLDVHGLPPLLSGNDSLSHMLFVQAERPEVYERTRAFLEPMDYLAARLTGRIAANACTAFPLLLTDNRRLPEIAYSEELIEIAGIDRDKLPPLAPMTEPVGPLLDVVADELGLARGTPVYAGVNDTQSVAVGAGSFRDGQGGVNAGTTTQVLAHIDSKKADVDNAILSMPSAIAGRYMALVENGLGGKLVEHFVTKIVFADDAFADHSRPDRYESLEDVVAGEAAGSGGLLYLPWLTGAQAPVTDPHARGAFLNVSLGTTRTRMLRAVLEGVAFNMRWVLPAVEKLCGHEFAELRFSGGGAVSDQWAQIMADVMARPVLQVEDARYLTSRATAFLGFVQAGLSDLDQVERFCPIKARYEPRAENRDTYDRLFEQFEAAYERIRPIFSALNEGA